MSVLKGQSWKANTMANKRIQRIATLALLFSSVKANEKSFSTPFAGTLHTDGNIFEIVAKSEPVSVLRFDINMDSATDTIVVRTQPGVRFVYPLKTQHPTINTYNMFNCSNVKLIGRVVTLDDTGWALVNSFPGVVGQGKNNATPLPAFDVPLVIPAGSKQAFYITTTAAQTNPHMWYSMGTSEGSMFASNNDMEVLEGHAVGTVNGWTGWTTPRKWNGVVHYSVPNNEPTISPKVHILCCAFFPTKFYHHLIVSFLVSFHVII